MILPRSGICWCAAYTPESPIASSNANPHE